MSRPILPNGNDRTSKPRPTAAQACYQQPSMPVSRPRIRPTKATPCPRKSMPARRLAQQEGYTVPESHLFVTTIPGRHSTARSSRKLRDLVHQRPCMPSLCMTWTA